MPAIAVRVMLIAASLTLGACSFAPTLKVPDVPTANAYKEEAPWTQAQPADALARDSWWTLYGDAELDGYQQRLIVNSPDIAAALARYQQAQALSDQLHSGLFPTLIGTGNVQRDRQSEAKPLRMLGSAQPHQMNMARTRLAPSSITNSICGAAFAIRSPPATPAHRRRRPISSPHALACRPNWPIITSRCADWIARPGCSRTPSPPIPARCN